MREFKHSDIDIHLDYPTLTKRPEMINQPKDYAEQDHSETGDSGTRSVLWVVGFIAIAAVALTQCG